MERTYKIGEAAELLKLKTYVLRFWETEFPDVVPLRTEKGQRLYTLEHIALLERIRYLLHDRGLTIGGARKILAEEKERGAAYVFDFTDAGKGQGRTGEEADAPLGKTAALLDMSGASPAGTGNGPLPGPSFFEYLQEEDDGPPAWAKMREQGPDGNRNMLDGQRLSQYNLPGIARAWPESAPPLHEEEASLAGQRQYFVPEYDSPPDDPRMLPLFTVARSILQPEANGPRAVRLAGTRGGPVQPARGGDNFIQPGAAGHSSLAASGKELADALQARDMAVKALEERSGQSRAELLGILSELRALAAVLRGRDFHE